ncbi:iron transporter [Thalassospira xiamenensis]|jgi:hypothetical protein|nr:iron transporter [Thalassospira xiamenensis]KZB56810.1 hypothetical protein AUP41_14370 [Thalassospira xiamenensis]MCK2167034.1 DUF3649 domain-containing protein [Thalassospira xiamenensis]
MIDTKMTGFPDVIQAFAITSRVILAVFGGYAVAAMIAVLLSVALPMPRVDATLFGMLISFIVWAAGATAVFLVRRTAVAWVMTLLFLAVLGIAFYLLQAGGGI